MASSHLKKKKKLHDNYTFVFFTYVAPKIPIFDI
jgi:hypothetical protein